MNTNCYRLSSLSVGSAALLTFASAFQSNAEEAPVFAARTLYAPGHFGNGYEVAGEHEMRELLGEAKEWGFNRYADWFDTIDCADPFADPHYNLACALWDRKKTNFRIAQSLGLACELTITPNHVYLDQVRPEVAAVKADRIFGQLVCPSKPEGRAIILRNYENLFSDLAKAGVRLNALCPCPYDYGGCACDACRPWILTFARVCKDIHAIAEKYHPGIEMHFIGWWWSDEEHRQFAEWADREAPGWVKSIALHIPYGKLDVADVVLPAGCERRAFVHIGYAEDAEPKDIYGHLGPVIAAKRIEATVAALKAHGCTGVMAYSEGAYDDVNKALLAGLASGRFATSDDVLIAYATRYFAADAAQARAWADWLEPFGHPFAVDPAAAAGTLKTLRPASPDWRFRQWELKVELLAQNQAIMRTDTWTGERLAAVRAFWAAQDDLQRNVYGLGPLRHVLARRFTPLPWYASWAAYAAEKPGVLTAEQ